MERQIPTSLMEKYETERIELYNLLWTIENGIAGLISGNVSSYSIGNRSCTYQDVTRLRELKDETERRIDEIEAYLRGASARNVTVSTFLDPSICIPRWWWIQKRGAIKAPRCFLNCFNDNIIVVIIQSLFVVFFINYLFLNYFLIVS